jgi:imidazolonepropionase-like amidohydrolase
VCVALLLAAAAAQAPSPTPAASAPVLFEGARVIAGDGRAPIEDAAFLVDRDFIVAVGKRGAVKLPPGGTRVSLAGKTVMPALVDTHVHLGYQKGLSFAAENFTRETLVDQLNRYAYAGVGVVTSLGTDPGDLPFQLRTEQEAGRLGGAVYLSAGRGIGAPNAGPGTPELKASAYGVTTEDEARKAVRDEVAKKVAFVKVWVDDRNGTVEKLSPTLYRAVIDEAHKLNARVVAHVYYLADAKALAQAGVNGFAHLPRDREADDELVALMKQHDVFMIPNMSISENGVHSQAPAWLDDPFLAGLVSKAEIDRLRGTYARRSPEAVERARSVFAGMQRSLMKLHHGGVTIAFGTDAGAVRDHFYAYTDHHELQVMVQAGMSRADVLTAATKTSAGVLHLPQHGAISAGKRADFVVLDANPLDDIANTEKIAQVYLRGRAVDRRR